MNTEERKEYMKRWRAAHKDKVRSYSLKYYYQHKDDTDFIMKRSEYAKKRYHTNEEFREHRKAQQLRYYHLQKKKNYHPILTDEVVTLN
ncbi:MAG: hypothetical protein KBT34_10285 [Prevotella sp.]|nr:hypothetical protein [Candidatus Prevotella equi]